MSTYSVMPTTVAACAREFAYVADDLGAVVKAQAFDSKAMGGGTVASNVHEFYDNWTYAVSQMTNGMEQLIANMKTAAEYYAKTDTTVCVASGF